MSGLNEEHAKLVIDGIAVSATVATLMQWLPPIAALLTCIWTVIRIAETETVKRIYIWVKSRLS